MKRFCKIIALLMGMLMLVSVFAACQEKKPNKTEAPETQVEVDPDRPKIEETFGGETIKFFINGSEGGNAVRSIILTDQDPKDYEVCIATQERNDKVEAELGVKIQLAGTCGMQEGPTVLKPILLAHTGDYDVIGLYQYFDLGLALNDTAGSFYNYLKMPEGSYIDLDAPYWNRRLFDTLAVNGAAFFLTGNLCLQTVSTLLVSYVNADLWDQYKATIKTFQNNPEGLDNVYEIVKKGYWTMDFWMELAKMGYKDLNADDAKDYMDQAGVMTYNAQLNNIMTDCFAAGCNVHYSYRDTNGTPVMDFNSEQMLGFAEKLYQLLCESDAVTIPWIGEDETDSGTYIMDFFADGRILATVNSLGAAEDYLADMKSDFYVLPLPMYDRNQFDEKSDSLGYTSQLFDSVSQYAICKDAGDDRIPAITATMELLGYYSRKMVTPVYYDKALKERYTRNPEDKEMIDLTAAGVYGDFALMWSHELGDITWFFRQNYAAHSNMASKLKQQNKAYKEKMKKLIAAIDEAFYVE